MVSAKGARKGSHSRFSGKSFEIRQRIIYTFCQCATQSAWRIRKDWGHGPQKVREEGEEKGSCQAGRPEIRQEVDEKGGEETGCQESQKGKESGQTGQKGSTSQARRSQEAGTKDQGSAEEGSAQEGSAKGGRA